MPNNELAKNLNLRQVMMIAIGGTIGTGLFVGINIPLQIAGNLGTPIAYFIAGFVMMLTMMCLGELSSAIPHSGSFQHYMSILFTNQYWSYIVGWLYWLSWVLTISADLTATSMILHDFFNTISVSIFVLGIILFITCIHVYSAKVYGESETIFTSIKIITIIIFIFSCFYLLYFFEPSNGLNPIFNTQHSLPLGLMGILTCMTTVTYAYQGIEMVATVIGESKDASKYMSSIIKMLVGGVLVFYVLTTSLLALIYPIGYISAISPFVWVFNKIHISYAGTIMQSVIILCGLSSCSGAVYASSRLLWSMSKDNVAPKYFKVVSNKGVPIRAVMVTLLIASIALVTQWYAPEKVYLYLISSTGQIGCLAWLCICLCLLKFRRAQKKGLFVEYEAQYKIPFFPFLPIMAILLNAIFIIGLWWSDSGLNILIGEVIIITIFTLAYFIKKRAPHSLVKSKY